MINHARTLLLNINGDGYGGQPGDEYIPADYVAATLPSYLLRTREVLFGHTPDRLRLNYYARQLLGLLHSTELAEFVTSLDPRVTYDVLPGDELFDSQFGTFVRAVSHDKVIYLQGLRTDERDTPSKKSWVVTLQSSGFLAVRPLFGDPSGKISILSFTNGLSDAVELGGSTLSFRVPQASVPSVGDIDWYVESTVRPDRTLDQMLADFDALTEDVRLELFKVGGFRGATEPVKTFYNLYRYHPELSYRLGGVLLALIWDTDLLVKESVTG
jgi:hypothetical protein